MAVEIRDGWMFGTLADDTGKEWPIERHNQTPTGAQHGSPVNLVLHTTETDGVVDTLQFPSNFQCGEGRIIQHIKLGYSGDAVFTYDRDCIGIEMVARCKLDAWLPSEATLGPTVALVAWLHKTHRIRTGLTRPKDWPIKLDRLPAAVTGYYRRAEAWPAPGVYGHVEVPDNSHYDPGSFDYPTFFARVLTAVTGDDMAYEDFKAGWKSFRAGEPAPAVEGDKKFGWNAAAFAAQNPKPGVPGPHSHTFTGSTDKS